MMLRSSSTPVLGSLLSSFSESPNNNRYQSEVPHATPKDTPNSIHQNFNKLSCIHSGSQNYTKSLWHSSPSNMSRCSGNGFRRVQSEGNLEELTNVSYNVDELSFPNVPKKFARKKTNSSMLEGIPSFSYHNLGTCQEDELSDEDEDPRQTDENSGFGNGNQFKVTNVSEYVSLKYEGERKMYLATGLGVIDIGFFDEDGSVAGGGGGGGGNYRPVAFDRDGSGGGGGGGGGGTDMEEHYKRMLEESPGNPLFLRNYAYFLYQTKGDLKGAEEYYSRAILADPGDGEILSQYAKLVWELHRDKVRATNYFERAVQASSQDSHIQAAYASFLWEIEDEDQEEELEDPQLGPPPLHSQVIASATA